MYDQVLMVQIDWLDSGQQFGWLEARETKIELAECQTSGFLVGETEDAVAVAQSRIVTEGFATWGEVISIPKFAITGRRDLSVTNQ